MGMSDNAMRDEIYGNFRALGKGLPPLTKERERELVARRESGDETAAHELALSSVNFIISFQLRRFPFQVNLLEDALMSALVEVLRAAESFDPDRGTFLNQVALEIKGSFVKSLQKGLNVVHKGSKKIRQAYEIRSLREDVLNSTGSYPTDEEVSAATGLSLAQIRDRDELWSAHTVTTTTGEDGHEISVLEMVSGSDEFTAEDEAERSQAERAVLTALSGMPEARRTAYILVVVEGKTLYEARDEMGLKYHNSVVNHVKQAKSDIAKALSSGTPDE